MSTRLATSVKVFASPATLYLMLFPGFLGRSFTLTKGRFALSLPFYHLPEQLQSFLDAPPFLMRPGLLRDYTNYVAGGNPIELVSRPACV